MPAGERRSINPFDKISMALFMGAILKINHPDKDDNDESDKQT